MARYGLIRHGRLGSMRFGWARFGMVRQVRHYKVGLDKTGFGQVCTAGTVGLRVVRFGSVY
jgi:hypothetical protein